MAALNLWGEKQSYHDQRRTSVKQIFSGEQNPQLMLDNRGHLVKVPGYLWQIPRLTPYWVRRPPIRCVDMAALSFQGNPVCYLYISCSSYCSSRFRKMG